MAPTSILLYCLFDRNTCQSLFHQVSCHSMNIPCFPIERNLAVSTCAVSIVYKGADVVEIRASTEIVGYFIDHIEEFVDGVAHADVAA